MSMLMRTLRTLAILMFIGVAHAALADDGGFVGIKVQDIQMYANSYSVGTGYVQSKLADPNFTVKMNGAEAAKLMAVLPSDLTVMTSMYKNNPKWVKAYNSSFRSLAITGQEGQPRVVISCDSADLGDYVDENSPPKITPHADGVHCRVEIQANDDGDIEYNYNPKKLVCGG